MSFLSLNGLSLRALVFESYSLLILLGPRAVIFIFSPAISPCSVDASLWWNGCIPMSFTSLIVIFTHVQGNIDFAICI